MQTRDVGLLYSWSIGDQIRSSDGERLIWLHPTGQAGALSGGQLTHREPGRFAPRNSSRAATSPSPSPPGGTASFSTQSQPMSRGSLCAQGNLRKLRSEIGVIREKSHVPEPLVGARLVPKMPLSAVEGPFSLPIKMSQRTAAEPCPGSCIWIVP